MSKADSNYQRECDRVRRETRASAPARERFSKGAAIAYVFARSERKRFDYGDRPEHAWADEGRKSACLSLLEAMGGARVSKKWLRQCCIDRATELELAHRLRPGDGTSQTWGKGEAVARAYGAYREYLDIAEWAS